MRPTHRGSSLFAVFAALAFSAALFEDILVAVVVLLLFALIVVDLAWVITVSRTPSKYVVVRPAMERETTSTAEFSFSRKTLPGREVRKEFQLQNRSGGELSILPSDAEENPFLRFEPKRIGRGKGNQRGTRILASFKSPYAGDYSSEKLNIRMHGPLGLFYSDSSIPLNLNFVVYPRIREVVETTSAILGQASAVGESSTNSLGAGTEFYDLRFYQSGDDLRSINWKATARLGRLIVEDRAKEVSGTCYLVLESLASSNFDRDRIASAFLQAANLLTVSRREFGVVVYDGENVTFEKKIDDPSVSLRFALEAALDFAKPTFNKAALASSHQSLVPISSRGLKTNRDELVSSGLALLSVIEEIGRTQTLLSLEKNQLFKALNELLAEGENSGAMPVIIYVGGLYSSLQALIELGDRLKQSYGAQLLAVNPTAPWVAVPSDAKGVRVYEANEKKIKALRLSGINCIVGDPLEAVQELFSTSA